MTDKVRVKLIHEGDYIAEVELTSISEPEGWEPYLSSTDAGKLDDVRQALKSGDLKAATRLAKVYTISPVSV